MREKQLAEQRAVEEAKEAKRLAEERAALEEAERLAQAELAELLHQQERQARDAFGRRWVVCEKCGEAKLADEFRIYGGAGRVNLGICYDCSEP